MKISILLQQLKDYFNNNVFDNFSNLERLSISVIIIFSVGLIGGWAFNKEL